ncbi:MAG: MobA/MobL family protein [Clostridia bacterium]|nr:MobA/MobL family protein [Clostridia bacterium]
MAIYHFEAKVITRTTGRTAVGAAAYMSCSEMTSEYDGIHHNYTRKQGLVFEKVFLPENAPAEWADREELWNAVEAAETAKDSRLARQIILALPIELNHEQQIKLLSDYVQRFFVSDGMCADVAIHDTGDDNPHAHIMLTLRPLDENGKWQSKTEKEYLCIKDGKERGFTAAEFKAAQAEGWEKQYQYKVGKKKAYMVPTEAEVQGYERASKYPKCTRYGRQNPTYERWNDVIMLDSWRTCWAGAVNRALEAIGSRERVDHRSHALRGLDEQPTIHEGVTARALEKKGIISERCETNRQIRKDNALLRRLKEMVTEMIRKIRGSVTNIAENLEANWMYMVEAQYHLTQILNEKQDILNQLEPILDDYEQYVRIQDQIRKLIAQRDKLIAQRKATLILQIRKRNELAEQIDSLTRQLEGRRKAKENLLKARRYPSEKEMQEVGKRLYAGEEKVTRLEKEESTYSHALQRRQEDYSRWIQNAQNMDRVSLSKARTTFRSENINHLASKLKAQYGADFQSYILQGAVYDTDRWCAGRENPEHNPNERKSVHVFLERELLSQTQKEKPHRKSSTYVER